MWRRRQRQGDSSRRCQGLMSEIARIGLSGPVTVMIVLIAGLGCGGGEAERIDLGPADGPEREITDSRISLAVEAELSLDEAVDANSLDVSTAEGIVTLSGTVRNLLAEERAMAIARATRGVRSVIDRVDVRAVSRNDLAIRGDVLAALVTNPATESYEIRVEVEDGVVTLEGTVESWAERRLVWQVVAGVRGVRDIVNDIDVSYVGERSDVEIEAEVRRKLMADVWVADGLIDVSVEGGVVRLRGTVGSAAERDMAIRDALVAGVNQVKADDLDVEWWARDEMRRSDRTAELGDDEIREAVSAALAYDPRVMSLRTEVRVEDGVVTLTGIVSSFLAKRAAEQDARHTVGVWRVRNLIKVRPSETLSDEELEERVTEALARDPYLERYEVEVSAVDGRVYLNGAVDSYFEKSRADEAASRVMGAVEIINNLMVAESWSLKSDAEIREDVMAELFWNPWIDAGGIEVRVEDGTVTLGGTVETWFQRSQARAEAYDGGAREVRLDLRVEHGPKTQIP